MHLISTKALRLPVLPAISAGREAVSGAQKGAIRALESAGFSRRETAAAIGVTANMLDQVMCSASLLGTVTQVRLSHVAVRVGERGIVRLHDVPDGPLPRLNGLIADEVVRVVECIGSASEGFGAGTLADLYQARQRLQEAAGQMRVALMEVEARIAAIAGDGGAAA